MNIEMTRTDVNEGTKKCCGLASSNNALRSPDVHADDLAAVAFHDELDRVAAHCAVLNH